MEKNKKVLFVAGVDIHIKYFHLPYLHYFKEQGYEVHVATNSSAALPYCDRKHGISMARSPFKACNIHGYKELKKLIERENFELIHCHMPMAAFLTRLAAKRNRKTGTKVIYTAHGFHFFKGAPLLNWLIYYPIEKVLAHYTDCLITINEEDFFRARKHRFAAKQIEKVNGVGIDLKRFKAVSVEEKQDLRKRYGYEKEDFILMYVAEIRKQKGQQELIECIPRLKEYIPHLKLLLVGGDGRNGYCQKLCKELQVEEQIDFLGLRNDIPQLLSIADLYVAPSQREGLPVNVMEAIASGLPICATKIRGHVDLIQDEVNGKLFEKGNKEELISIICEIYAKKTKVASWIQQELIDVKRYEIDNVKQALVKIYEAYIK
ncbi:glycosyltransferase family 1 protein [Sporanaerobium hydrogeniformans]|uniref:Glycosyltransferase family 1 protein n=1 Tax=Sporanaerobium hydrogeniformans TaxID=3072179 RepID=A0AC61DBK3_9FIRM|nr:glycosyltransferase family 4 protein [Sporanaerobium hydrogeniformans]PHV70150.1 glycosyltransferase family 1 protein [Sporanaerobium hydrogeniformans]